MSDIPNLSAIRDRLYELDAKRTQGRLVMWAGIGHSLVNDSVPDEWPVTGEGAISDNVSERVLTAYTDADQRYFAAMPDAITLIREQHRLLVEAREVIGDCAASPWKDTAERALSFLRQLEESGL